MAKHAQNEWQAGVKAMARYTQMWWIKTVLTTKRTKKSPILSPATIKWFFFILFSNQFKAQLNNCSSLTNGRIQAFSWIFFHLDIWLIESVKAFDSYRPPFFCVFNLGNSVSSSNFIIRCTTDKSNHNYINQCRLCVYFFVYVSHKYARFPIEL